ncbi:MAG: leucyl/phenylalanyl-tRNA--protein transferase [Fimbriimonadaceae bacterium]|nr:leucyl/phenylalanyl-tRNA--protein transferase [Fimbriimonadaceae bacterium]
MKYELGALGPEDLVVGYANGAFPMADEEGTIRWWRPEVRALFPMTGLRLSRSMRRFLRNHSFAITFDQAFRETMWNCRRPEGNWINEEMLEAYGQAFRQGWAHSCEVWNEGRLVGGTYGLAFGSAFFAESMFHRESNASKVALHSMLEKCRSLGFVLFDAQIMNPHLDSLGAFEVPHALYMRKLRKAMKKKTNWGLEIPEDWWA